MRNLNDRITIAFVIDRIEFSIPLGIAYLAGALKKSGCVVKIFEIANDSEKIINDVIESRAKIVAYSVITGKQHTYLYFNRNLKKKHNCISIFGGPHVTFFPESIEEDGVDAVCLGEGELAFEEFVRLYSNNYETPEKVFNFWVKKEGKIYKNPVRPLVDDLNTLPFPDREEFFEKFPIINEYPIKHFIAHRGCPFRCTYCFNKSYNDLYDKKGKIFRSRDPHEICEEINLVRSKTRMKMAAFVDDTFTLDKNWLKTFSEIYRWEVGLPYSINTRFDRLDEEIVRILKESNCTLVYAGVEAGNEHIRKKVLKRGMSSEVIKKGVELLKEQKIKLLTENIIGIPGETYSEATETLKLNMEIKPDFANCSLFAPYPKLELTQYALENNFFSGNFSEININYIHKMTIREENKTIASKKLNLRCFFSLIVKHPCLYTFFERFIFPLKCNRFFSRLGDLIDGLYLKKCLPFRMGIKETAKNFYYFLSRYRRVSNL